MAKYKINSSKKYDDMDGVWRTIKGRHIFIKKGQSLRDAMQESGISKKEQEERPVAKRLAEQKAKENKNENRSNFYNRLNEKGKKKYDDYISKGYSESDIENTLMYETQEELMQKHGVEFANDVLPDLQDKANKVVNEIENKKYLTEEGNRIVRGDFKNEEEKNMWEKASKEADELIKASDLSYKEERQKLTRALAREVYGQHISDEVADRYGQKIASPDMDGFETTDLKDWEWDKDKLEWTNAGLRNKLIYLTQGYDASQKDAEKQNADWEKWSSMVNKVTSSDSFKEKMDQAVKELNEKYNKYARTKHEGFGDYNDDYIPVYNNEIDYKGDFDRADLSKLNDEELATALKVQTEELEKANTEILGDQRTRNGQMNKIFNTAKKQKYGTGVERLQEELAKRDDKPKDFVQKIDMSGGEYTYDADRIKRMEKSGTKPREHSYTGGGWEGTNYNSKLTTKDIAKTVGDNLKKNYPGVKVSRKTDYNSIDFNIVSSTKDLYLSDKDIDKMTDEQVFGAIHESSGGVVRLDEWLDKNKRKNANGGYTTQDAKDYLKEDLAMIKSRSENQRVRGNEYYLSEYGKEVVSSMNKNLDSYNYDDSDAMVDYFDRNFYGGVHIGKWDKPYQVEPERPVAEKLTRQRKNMNQQIEDLMARGYTRATAEKMVRNKRKRK